LEQIDPENICEGKTNWLAAEADTGGTPGKQNSVYASKPDHTGPKMIRVIPLDSMALLIQFDERLESILPTVDQFIIAPPLEIGSVHFDDATLTRLRLVLSAPLEPSTAYTLTVEDIYDCPGNEIQKGFSKTGFVLPEKAVPGDIIVNEILFDPRPTGVDFVEVYNRSKKIIDLKNWLLRNVSSAAGRNSTTVSLDNFLINPKEYRVFTEDANVLKGEYLMGLEENFLETDLPAFNDDQGFVVLVNDEGMAIDSMQYSDSMHAPFIRDDEGISLERISPDGPGNEASNWRSASSTNGFATPGYVNSNVRQDVLIDDGSVTVEPELIQRQVFALDFAQIKYRFDRGGFIANIKIFDFQGRTVREIAENQLLGTQGFFRWDGDLDNGAMASMGYYMVWFEIFDAEGQVRIFRKRVAIY